jgi:molecular chaperone GrpE (heat shock protein)
VLWAGRLRNRLSVRSFPSPLDYGFPYLPLGMSEPTVSKLPKWPFFLGDALLVGVAAVLVFRGEGALSVWRALAGVVAVGGGAWLAVTPFLEELRASSRIAESANVRAALERFANLEVLANQIQNATARWQTAQEQAEKTVATAGEITGRISAEAKAFVEFLQKANDSEKANLRLEIEKLRRAEGEWLQVVTRVLDHIFALYQAAVRSGQPSLIEQLGQFQNACRDAARRVGLGAFAVASDEVFDEKLHQLVEAQETVPPASRVAETIATGYTFQGQLLRRALVTLRPGAASDAEPSDLSAGLPGEG